MNAATSTNAISAQGRTELLKHVAGKRLTRNQAIKAKCYDCMGGYTDGKQDCRIHVCPLYPFMPYRNMGSKAITESNP
jgi:hypothetical protein